MFKKIPQDKKKHIVAGAVIALVFTWIGYLMWPGAFLPALVVGFGVAALAGFGFELFSYVTGLGHAEWMDAIFTVAGGALGIAIALAAFGVFSLC